MDSCKKRIKQILTDWGRFLCVIPLRIFYEPLIYIIMKFNFPFSFYFFFLVEFLSLFGEFTLTWLNGIFCGKNSILIDFVIFWGKMGFEWKGKGRKKMENFAQVLRKEACELISRKHWKLTEMTIFEIGKN